MKNADDYIIKNKQSWNNRTDYHVSSAFYDVEGFLNGNSTLNSIELELLGNIEGKRILHLQCHFGMDTLSLARLGAIVTGIDFSDKAIAKANELTKQTGLNAKFICADVYAAPQLLNEQFDIVFTSYGTIGWLPDMQKWAAVINHFLKPGGHFVFAEFHPVVWMYDNHFNKVEYKYFKSDAIFETLEGTYADKQAPIADETISWNHSISEVVNAILSNKLVLNQLNEYDFSPYNCLEGMEEREPGKWQIQKFSDKIPLVYAILATKQ